MVRYSQLPAPLFLPKGDYVVNLQFDTAQGFMYRMSHDVFYVFLQIDLQIEWCSMTCDATGVCFHYSCTVSYWFQQHREIVSKTGGFAKSQQPAALASGERPCTTSSRRSLMLRMPAPGSLGDAFLISSHGEMLDECIWIRYGYGSIPINTIFSGMNIHLPAILGFTRYQGFDPSPYE